MIARIQTISTPDGPFSIVADDEERVLASGWTEDEGRILERISPKLRPTSVTRADLSAAAAVDAYYGGSIDAITTVATRQPGTDLQQAGWEALRRITPGEPLSYTEFASALGAPKAIRAAASICARNAVALFVPCHRVLRGDGTLGGFAWGVEVKQALLAREARWFKIRTCENKNSGHRL